MKKKLFIRDLEKRKSSSSLFVSALGADSKVQDCAPPKKFHKPDDNIVKVQLLYGVTEPKIDKPDDGVVKVQLLYGVTEPKIDKPDDGVVKVQLLYGVVEPKIDKPDDGVVKVQLLYGVVEPVKHHNPNPGHGGHHNPGWKPKLHPVDPIGVIEKYGPPPPGWKPKPGFTTMAVGEEGSAPKPPGSWRHDHPKPGFWHWFKRER